MHYTPVHGSWLNQAEIEIGLLSRQCLGTRRIPDLKTLRREVRAWNRDANRRQIRINWKFDRRAARRQFGYNRKSIKRVFESVVLPGWSSLDRGNSSPFSLGRPSRWQRWTDNDD